MFYPHFLIRCQHVASTLRAQASACYFFILELKLPATLLHADRDLFPGSIID